MITYFEDIVNNDIDRAVSKKLYRKYVIQGGPSINQFL